MQHLPGKKLFAPLAQLAEQVTLNHDYSKVEFSGATEYASCSSDRHEMCYGSAAATR